MTKTMSDAPAIDFEELRKGLPKGPWAYSADGLIRAADGGRIAERRAYHLDNDTRDRIGRAIVALPDMLAEIERLESFNADLIAENERLHKSCTIEHRDYDRLRSLNAEMREALVSVLLIEEGDWQAFATRVRAILSKTETEQP